MSNEINRLATMASSPAPAEQASVQLRTLTPRSAVAWLTRGVRAVVPYSNYVAQRLGAAGIVGLAMCVFSVVTLFSANTPLRQQLATDTATLESVNSTGGSAASLAAAASPAAQVQLFLGELPTRNDVPALMNRIVSASVAAGVALDEGDYDLSRAGKSGSIARYRLSFPVVGSYPEVRSFIEQALVAVPAMSLDGLALERDDVAESTVTATLDFALFLNTGE